MRSEPAFEADAPTRDVELQTRRETGSSLNGVVAVAEARLGRLIAHRWRLDELIGVGGVAAVYAATHRNGRRVAIKIMHPDASADPEARARFLREGHLANRVAHPGVVAVFDDGVADDGCQFLVMELLEGETIHARWERKGRRLEVPEVLSIADQLLDVLAVAHAAGVVHRDIKPSNLFLTRGGQIKLLDFGLARAGVAPGAVRLVRQKPMGTPAFMPPEQALGRASEIEARTDLWSVGATLLLLLTGRPVHEAPTVEALVAAAMTRRAPPIAKIAPHLPSDVAVILDRALQFERERRWRDAREMQVAVRRAYARWRSSLGTGRARTVASAPDPDAAERSSLAAVRLALAVLIGVIGGSHLATMHAARARWAPAAVTSIARRNVDTAMAEMEIESSPPPEPTADSR